MDAPRRVVVVFAVGLGLLLAAGLGGCVRRTLRITSEPSGALVWVNDREVGRTPVDVDFVHYGTYDVRLVKDGYEALIGSGKAKPPIWDHVGLDLVAEIIPAEFESLIEWHYELEPKVTDPDELRAGLLERAGEVRRHLADETTPETDAGREATDSPETPTEAVDGV